MEKSLILFRHGKSDWAAAFQSDHERPVAKRGIKAAKTMGKLLAAAGQVPAAIVTSSALRARTTAELAAEAGSWNCPMRITDELYESTPERVLEVIRQEPDTTNTLMLVGHEPTWSGLTGRLTGGSQVVFPTAAMVRIDFDLSGWDQIAFGRGQLVWLLPPKLFTEGEIEVG